MIRPDLHSVGTIHNQAPLGQIRLAGGLWDYNEKYAERLKTELY
jgi:hypothetical protein